MTTVLDAQFGMAAESAYGTPVTVTRFYDPSPGDGFDYRPNRVQGSGLHYGSRGPRRARRVTPNFDFGGAFNFDVLSKGFGLLLNHMCGGTASHAVVAGAVYQTVHTLGGALKPFTSQLNVPKIQADGSTVDAPLTATGCVIPSFGLAMDNADILKLKIDVDARDLSTATAKATASYPSGANLFTFAGAALYSGTFTAATTTALGQGSSALANITNFSMDVSRNADVSRFLAGNAGKKSIPIPGQAAVTGTLGIEYSDDVFRDAYLADSDLVLVANFEAATLTTGKETVQVELAGIRLEGELPKPSGETTKMSCNFTALEDDTNALLRIIQRTLDTAI